MERLTEYSKSTGEAQIIGVPNNRIAALWITEDEERRLFDGVAKLADFEDAEENGTRIKLPCKVGDTVYRIDTDVLCKNKEVELIVVDNIIICNDGEILLKADAHDDIICTADNLINGTPFLDYCRVFSTREAAEAALKERSDE